MSEIPWQTDKKFFAPYGLVGLAIMVLAELLLFAGVGFVAVLFTPIAWTGYILFIDALILKLQGHSLIHDRPGEFSFMLPYSVLCWLVFEAFNLHLHNWHYINLPENLPLRLLGYFWSFATIFPGILLTSELIDLTGLFRRWHLRPIPIRRKGFCGLIIFGLIFLIGPLFFPTRIAVYLFAFVWVGFVLLLDPVNALAGGKSLFKELGEGRIDKLFSLFLAGLIGGILWEFWNYWATTKWIYDVPFLRRPKIFEMPLVGFLGFPPFAVECYVMWNFALLWRKRK